MFSGSLILEKGLNHKMEVFCVACATNELLTPPTAIREMGVK